MENIVIYTARSRLSKRWTKKEYTWQGFVKLLSKTTRTDEKYADYMQMTVEDQGSIKDVGGFVGGELLKGKRGKSTIINRYIITVDIDNGKPGIINDINEFMYLEDYEGCMYSTHKHSPENPRLRLVLLLSKPVTPGESEYITRCVGKSIGMDAVDRTTFQPERLMYWPSTSCDGEYIFEIYKGLALDPLEFLKDDWTYRNMWPQHPLESDIPIEASMKLQEDPHSKNGVIGAFCRTYPISSVMHMPIISDVYENTSLEDRYTYLEGSTSGGVVSYDDKFIYSHHHSDPLGFRLLNAFDLVRELVCNGSETKAIKHCLTLEGVSGERASNDYQGDFEDDYEEENLGNTKGNKKPREKKSNREWLKLLKYDDNGKVLPIYKNLKIVLKNKFSLSYDVFRNKFYFDSKKVWNKYSEYLENDDIPQMHIYCETKLRLTVSEKKLENSITAVSKENSFHPVKDYLEGLPVWDGKERMETIFQDYFGHEDTEYIRCITRKFLCAAVHRIMNPGCKWDHMIVLYGATGIGKSSLLRLLFKVSFDDNINLADFKDKTGPEKIQGIWCIEVPEMSGMGKIEVETLKGFITRQEDTYRPAYGRFVETKPRQVVFAATTNSDKILKDVTGNRRYLMVSLPNRNLDQELLKTNVDQIWSEVMTVYKDEKLYIENTTVKKEAENMQNAFLATDGSESYIQDMLEMPVPPNWESMKDLEKRDFIEKYQTGDSKPHKSHAPYYLEYGVSTHEIWFLWMGRDLNKKTNADSQRLALALKSLGFERTNNRRRLQGRQRLYLKT